MIGGSSCSSRASGRTTAGGTANPRGTVSAARWSSSGGLLPRFHTELRAATMKRLRGEWPKPTRRLDVELTRRVELAVPTIEIGEMTERLWTGVFNGSMRDWLETVGLRCHIRVDGCWVLCFSESQEVWIRWHDTMDTALGFAQRVPPSVLADVSTGHDAIR
jgi:hypothetical protein